MVSRKLVVLIGLVAALGMGACCKKKCDNNGKKAHKSHKVEKHGKHHKGGKHAKHMKHDDK